MSSYWPPHPQQDQLIHAVLRVIAADYGNEDNPHHDAEREYSAEQLALAARDLTRAVDAKKPDEQPIGWTTDPHPTPEADEPKEPVHDELWSILDWALWGNGMGDEFREQLADAMVAAITPEQRDTALKVIEAWRTNGRGCKPPQQVRIEELEAENAQLRAQVAELSKTDRDRANDHVRQLREAGDYEAACDAAERYEAEAAKHV